MKSFACSSAAIILLAWLTGSAFGDEPPSPALEQNQNRAAITAMQGKPAPALAVTNWTNTKPLQLADLKGKIVVLDFWATWCGPCLASVPHNNELQKKYAGKGVVCIAIGSP